MGFVCTLELLPLQMSISLLPVFEESGHEVQHEEPLSFFKPSSPSHPGFEVSE